MFFATEIIKRTAAKKATRKPVARKAATKPKAEARAKGGGDKAVNRASPASASKGPKRVPAGDSSGRGGQFAPKDFAARLGATKVTNLKTGKQSGIPAGGDPYENIRIGPKSNERAFRGKQEATPKNKVMGGPGRQFEVGNRAESIALDYARNHINPSAVLLKQEGVADNFPFDMATHVPGKGIFLYEVKGGQPSNAPKAQQWRVTVNQTLTAQQKKMVNKMTPDQVKAWRKMQLAEAHDRKRAVAAEIKRQVGSLLPKGEKVHLQTMAVIFDNHRGIADVHVFDDIHSRIDWKDSMVASGHKGSFRFTVKKADVLHDMLRDWGDTLEAQMMKDVPKVVARLKAMINATPSPKTAVTKGEWVIEKTDEDQRYIAGWAMVTEVGGKEVMDRQGHVVSADEMTTAAHDFMRHFRVGKSMHKGDADQIEYTESIVFTKDVQEALGIDLGKVGWWLGGFATPETFAKVKSGEIKSLSIGGVGVLTEVE